MKNRIALVAALMTSALLAPMGRTGTGFIRRAAAGGAGLLDFAAQRTELDARRIA